MNSKQDYIHPARHKDQKVKKTLKLELQKQNTAVISPPKTERSACFNARNDTTATFKAFNHQHI